MNKNDEIISALIDIKALLEAHVCKTEERFAEVRADMSSLKADLAETKADVSSLKVDVSILKADVSTLKADVGTLKADVGTLKADMASARADIETIKHTTASNHFKVVGRIDQVASMLADHMADGHKPAAE